MFHLLKRIVGSVRRQKELHAIISSLPIEPDDVELKQDLQKKLNDQRARLHVLEWKATVQGRSTPP